MFKELPLIDDEEQMLPDLEKDLILQHLIALESKFI